MKTIKFQIDRDFSKQTDEHSPKPSKKFIPEWYKKADLFYKDENEEYLYNEKHGKDGHSEGKIPTWKSCPAIFDTFSAGYMLSTPCDIVFFIGEDGKIDCKVSDDKYNFFCNRRHPMDKPYFPTPFDHEEVHFAWVSDWSFITPEGYSVLVTHPFNRYDLPFVTVSGIEDSDFELLSGNIPFFIRKGFVGTIYKNTPFAQIFPFKRDNWSSEYFDDLTEYELYEKKLNVANLFRCPNGGIYKSKIWNLKEYK